MAKSKKGKGKKLTERWLSESGGNRKRKGVPVDVESPGEGESLADMISRLESEKYKKKARETKLI